ncbi:MAG: hypothetical protein ACK55Z_03985, partial [bacterium]
FRPLAGNKTVMTYLLIILASLFICFLVVKLFRFVLAFCLLCLGLIGLGLVMLPWNMDIGIQLMTVCICLLFITIVVTMFAGIVSALIVTPLILLWQGIKTLFIK